MKLENFQQQPAAVHHSNGTASLLLLPSMIVSIIAKRLSKALGTQRQQLFELHDSPWYPERLRNELTVLLSSLWTFELPEPLAETLAYKPGHKAAAAVLQDLSRKMGKSGSFGKKERLVVVVDVCSGSGGPIPAISQLFSDERRNKDERRKEDEDNFKFILTDLYPNADAISKLHNTNDDDKVKDEDDGASEKNLSYWTESVDAANIPENLAEICDITTSFGSFHHLPESVALEILRDTVTSGEQSNNDNNNNSNNSNKNKKKKKKRAIAIFEATGRSPSRLFGNFILVLLGSMLHGMTTSYRGRRDASTKSSHLAQEIFMVILLCVILPPLAIFDGFLSGMRTYEPEDYVRLLRSIPKALDLYDWEFQTIPLVDFEPVLASLFGSSAPVKSVASFLSLEFASLRILTGVPKKEE